MTTQISITEKEFDAALKEIRAEQMVWFATRQRQLKSAQLNLEANKHESVRVAIWIGRYLELVECSTGDSALKKNAVLKGRCRHPVPRQSA